MANKGTANIVKQMHVTLPACVFGTIWPYPIVVATDPINKNVLSNVLKSTHFQVSRIVMYQSPL